MLGLVVCRFSLSSLRGLKSTAREVTCPLRKSWRSLKRALYSSGGTSLRQDNKQIRLKNKHGVHVIQQFKISNVNKAIKNEQSSLVGLHAEKFIRSIASFLRRVYIQVHNCVVVQSMQTIMFYHVIMKNCRSSYQCTINCSHMQKLCHKKNLYKIIQFYQ